MTTLIPSIPAVLDQPDTPAFIDPYRHIVVALDGSEFAEQVLPYVLPLAQFFDAEITCVCAIKPINPFVLSGVSMPGGLAMGPVIDTQDEIERESDQ